MTDPDRSYSHEGELRDLHIRGSGMSSGARRTTFWGVCGCGWTSPRRSTQAAVQRDYRKHMEALNA